MNQILEHGVDVLCIGIGVMDITALPIPDPQDWKEKQRLKSITVCVGGDAANQSCRMADRKMKTAIVACIGDDETGASFCSALNKRGVDTGFMAVRKDQATTTAIVLVNQNGERHTFSIDGAHSKLCAEDLKEAMKIPKKAISLGSLFSMPELEANGLAEICKEARERGELVFADLASDKMGQGLGGIQKLLPHIDYFLPSESDSLEITETDNVEDAAKVFLDCGAANVVIKCGEKGCYYLTETENGWVPAVAVTPVDTTGAGDTMVGIFVTRILAGDTIADACRNACEAASNSTLYVGANAGNV